MLHGTVHWMLYSILIYKVSNQKGCDDFFVARQQIENGKIYLLAIKKLITAK